MSTWSRLVACSIVTALGCVPEPPSASSAPLTNATEHAGDPAVVGLVYAAQPRQLRCTGTLVAERVVLTAAHCGAHEAPGSFEVFFGASLDGEGARVALLDAVAHPAYAGGADDDLALLLLAEPAPVAPAPIRLDPLTAPAPFSARLVGFGVTAPGGGDDGRKREGTGRVEELAPRHLVLAADPSLPCSGDSGGPVFVSSDMGERVAGVVSRGDAECSARARAARVDAALEDFVMPALAGWAPGTVPPGGACVYDEHCEDGVCAEALDEPRIRYCSARCESGCAPPLACGADGLCRHATPTPGALGGACTDHADCVEGDCLRDARVCSVRCVSGRGDCPDGYSCAHLGGIDFYCMRDPQPPPPSCAAGAPRRARWPALVLALLAPITLRAVTRARRRRARASGDTPSRSRAPRGSIPPR